MKTTWSVDYIHKTARRPYIWCRNKCAELETKTGVNWVTYHANGKQAFLPRWNKDTPETPDEQTAEILLALTPKYGGAFSVTFLKLHEQTGLPLPYVMSVCKWLVKTQRLIPVQGRVDGVIAVYRRHQ